jgi:hypothetical protein
LSQPREDIDLMRAYFSVVPEPDGYLEAALIRDAIFAAMSGKPSDPSKHYFRFIPEKEQQQEFIKFLEF